MLNNVANN